MKTTISGSNYIGYTTSSRNNMSFQAFSTGTGQYLPGNFHYAIKEEWEQALQMAKQAFTIYQKIPVEQRADFLDTIADEIMALGDVLIERCTAETALPVARITGERARTCNQLKMFAELLRAGWWVDARIDTAQPQRQPVPKPDLRRMLMPIGPVAVFGASNFPLAFSTAGGDTASALAAGCPVIVKAHSSHPGTNELVASAIIRAAQKCEMPDGVFSSLYLSHTDVIQFVQHPVIKAVGFTGSREVGMRLFHAAVSRPDPIPVYAEMSAVNPVVLLEGALDAQAEKIAKDLTLSLTLGVGQFCTNPGLVLMIDNKTSQNFLQLLAQHVHAAAPAAMLNKNICQAYNEGIHVRQKATGITVLAKAAKEADAERYEAQPVVYSVPAARFLTQKALAEEIFGPSSLIVLCKSQEEMHTVLHSLEGQLTATLHATAADAQSIPAVVDIITQKAGRIIYGGYPTGVEVCHSMQHGGPFPATTDGRTSSVGTAAIYRFVRSVAYQDFPDHLLPAPLQNSNPLNIMRLVDGHWTCEPV
jgi:alpha-ketoglutaric semialdehyde dehydrogenase